MYEMYRCGLESTGQAKTSIVDFKDMTQKIGQYYYVGARGVLTTNRTAKTMTKVLTYMLPIYAMRAIFSPVIFYTIVLLSCLYRLRFLYSSPLNYNKEKQNKYAYCHLPILIQYSSFKLSPFHRLRAFF